MRRFIEGSGRATGYHGHAFDSHSDASLGAVHPLVYPHVVLTDIVVGRYRTVKQQSKTSDQQVGESTTESYVMSSMVGMGNEFIQHLLGAEQASESDAKAEPGLARDAHRPKPL